VRKLFHFPPPCRQLRGREKAFVPEAETKNPAYGGVKMFSNLKILRTFSLPAQGNKGIRDWAGLLTLWLQTYSLFAFPSQRTAVHSSRFIVHGQNLRHESSTIHMDRDSGPFKAFVATYSSGAVADFHRLPSRPLSGHQISYQLIRDQIQIYYI